MKIYQELITKAMTELGLRRVRGSNISEEQIEFFDKLPPIITVSRDSGSGGRPIAKMLSRKLGFKFYNSELMKKIAKSSKMRKGLLSQVDEKGRGLMTDFVHNMFNPDYVSDVDYMRHLCKVVLTIAYKGNAIILGRGANFITPQSSALRVRIIAPKRVRVRRAVQYEKYSLEDAKERIEEKGKDRKEFIKQYFGKNIRDSSNYDIVLNTAFYNLEQSVKVIETAFRQKFKKGTM